MSRSIVEAPRPNRKHRLAGEQTALDLARQKNRYPPGSAHPRAEVAEAWGLGATGRRRGHAPPILDGAGGSPQVSRPRIGAPAFGEGKLQGNRLAV